MVFFLNEALASEKEALTRKNLKTAIPEGTAKRVGPVMMTATTFIGLIPILWSTSIGADADVMKDIASPMVGV